MFEQFWFGRLPVLVSNWVTVLPSSSSSCKHATSLGSSCASGGVLGKGIMGLGGLLHNAAFVDFGPRFRAGV
jgi:hypothetical protein